MTNKMEVYAEISIECKNGKLLNSIYLSLLPDIKEEKIIGIKRDITKIDNSKICITLSSSVDKINKFRGVYSNILRLIMILSKLIMDVL